MRDNRGQTPNLKRLLSYGSVHLGSTQGLAFRSLKRFKSLGSDPTILLARSIP